MNDPEATKPNLSLLADIEFLCEFGIPAVRQYSLFPRDIERTCMYIVTSRGTKINFNLLLFFEQVVDYGLALKSDNGKLLFQRMLMLLRLNMSCVQKNAYSRSIMMQLLNMLHQKHHNLPSWQMFEKSTAVYNEEVGEASFSILSRLVLGDTTKCSFSHMDIMYGLIHTYRANNSDMSSDQYRKTRTSKGFSL
jgi:hypothetical protein